MLQSPHHTPVVMTDAELLDEFRHRNANYLAHLSAYIHLKAGETARLGKASAPLATTLVLTSVSILIDTVAHLNRLLAMVPAPSSTDFSGELRRMCSEFSATVGTAAVLSEDIDDGCLVRIETLLPIVEIITEVIATACTQVSTQGGASTIAVSLKKLGDAELRVEVRSCLPAPLVPSAPDRQVALSHRLVSALSERIGATAEFQDTSDGAIVQVTLPWTTHAGRTGVLC